MATLLDALMELEIVARTGARALGERSRLGRQLAQAVADARRVIAPMALRQVAEEYDPKIDLARIFATAELAGLGWPDMRDALNHYRELNPGGR